MLNISIRFAAVVLLVLLGVAGSSFAQNQPQMLSVLTVEVEPGANAQFEEFIQAFRAGADQQGSPLYWLTSQNEVGDGNTYTFTRNFGSWEEFENPTASFMADAYDEAELARLNGLYNASVASTSSSAYVVRPDLSRGGAPPAPEGGPAAVIYVEIAVRSGMEPQFEAVARQVIEATDATAPNVYSTMQATAFGVVGRYRVVILVNEWEDLDTPAKPIPQRLTEHFGALEGARINQEGASSIESIHVKLRRVRQDLARQEGN